MARRFLCALVGTALFLPAPAAGPPPDRAGRLREWRARLDAAAESAALGERERAAALYGAVVEQADRLGEEGLLVARAVDGLADTHREDRRCERAVPLYERAAAMWSRLLGESQPRRAVTLHNLGICYVELADWTAAERVLREALPLWEALPDPAGHLRETRRVLDAALQRRAIPAETGAGDGSR